MTVIETSAKPIEITLKAVSTEEWILKHLSDGSSTQHLSRRNRYTMSDFSDFDEYYRIQQKLGHHGSNFVHMFNPGTVSLFVQGMHEAFAVHQNFSISPEMLWYVIINEVSLHIKLQPETYRHLFTKDLNKNLIQVRDDSLIRGSESDWGRAIGKFADEFERVLPGEVMSVILPKFSTLTDESSVALLIAFMDAASSYYHYKVDTLCGIPRIRLTGTPADWKLFGIHIEQLRHMFPGLKSYFDRLIPTLRQIIFSVHGKVDVGFWESMYKYKSESGSDRVNGWVTTLFAHWLDWDDKLEPLPAWAIEGNDIPSTGFPAHITQVPFVWNYMGKEIPMTFASGAFGVDLEDGFLTPKLGFGVFEK